MPWYVRTCMPKKSPTCPRLHTCVCVCLWVCESRHATSPHRDTGLKVCGLACDVHCPALKVPSQSVITSKETGQQRGELTPPSVHPTLFSSSRILSLLLYCPYYSLLLSSLSSQLFFCLGFDCLWVVFFPESYLDIHIWGWILANLF